jgi:hypothetical protein
MENYKTPLANPSCNNSVTKVNSEAGLITDTTEIASIFNKFFIKWQGT